MKWPEILGIGLLFALLLPLEACSEPDPLPPWIHRLAQSVQHVDPNPSASLCNRQEAVLKPLVQKVYWKNTPDFLMSKVYSHDLARQLERDLKILARAYQRCPHSPSLKRFFEVH